MNARVLKAKNPEAEIATARKEVNLELLFSSGFIHPSFQSP